ncbi:TfoX/Sxy family protein [Cereibacter sp. SYSU M97828]|nr:TfoX/Sxy family protein [Cereibacter flavus]
MPKPLSPFCRHLIQCLDPLGPVLGRAMFGSTGLFLNGLMFGLVSTDDGVHIKADDLTRETFTKVGCTSFTYRSRKGEVALSYFRLPDAEAEDNGALLKWAWLGLEAARRQAEDRQGTDRPASDPWRSLIL